MKYYVLAAAAAALATPAASQDTDAAQPVQAVRVAEQPKFSLPAGTEVTLELTQTVTTKGKGWDEGDEFNLRVATDVLLGDYVVIPKGTKGIGKITWLTSRGAFGKSGKMDIELLYLEMGGRRINLDGTFRQEGDGATLATVGGVILAGVFAGFITGKSGVIPQGRELMATLESDLPVALPDGANLATKAVEVRAVPGTPAAEAEAIVEAQAEDEARAEAAKEVRPPAEIKIGGN